MKPNGRCIAKNCEDCNFFYSWDVENTEGLRKQEKECIFRVLADELPRIRGSIDGVQEAANEARNRAMETKEIAQNFGAACAKAFNITMENVKLLK